MLDWTLAIFLLLRLFTADVPPCSHKTVESRAATCGTENQIIPVAI
jgi:hypothetical protein